MSWSTGCTLREGAAKRLQEALEIAARLAQGIVRVEREGAAPLTLQPELRLRRLRLQLSRDHPPDLLLQQPPGRLPRLRRVGDEAPHRPGPGRPGSLPVASGGSDLFRGKTRGEAFLKPVLEGLARHYGFDLDTPFCRLPKSVQHVLLHGSGDEKVAFRVKGKGKAHLFRQAFEGVIPPWSGSRRGGWGGEGIYEAFGRWRSARTAKARG